jgi:hypothetical protein
MTDDEDDWEEIRDARVQALAQVFGHAPSGVLHAPHPFELGGNADVLAFPLAAGHAYVTAELTGKPQACYADYELMICHRSDETWGPNVISRLAPYTQEARIEAGESMDIDSATPAGSPITAFVFDTFAAFDLFGERFELRLCIGITGPELEFKKQHGAAPLLAALKRHGVHPFTDLDRASVPLEA